MAVPAVTTDDVRTLFRDLSADETKKAEALIPVVIDSLKQEADNVGKDLDSLLESGSIRENVFKSVVVDIVSRCLMTSTNSEPMSQVTESALGYSISGTYLVPGGGLFIKKSELARLGLRRQRIRMVDLYGSSEGN